MRRVKTWAAWDNGVPGRGMSHRDYRLMLSVARETEKWIASGSSSALAQAFFAFNANFNTKRQQ